MNSIFVGILKRFTVILLVVMISSCNSTNTQKADKITKNPEEKQMAGPPLIIYKTKADYFNNVAINYNKETGVLLSYPAVTDIIKQGDRVLPLNLDKGFLLDRRGIGPDLAFLKYTYEEYSGLSNTPDKDTLIANIIDADPLTEMYNCGSAYQYKNTLEELNRIINNDSLSKFKKLK